MATYSYRYDLAGGIYNGSTSYTQTYNTTTASSSVIIKAEKPGYMLRCYTIIASSTGAQLGNTVTAGTTLSLVSNITLRAVWDKIYKISYNLNGGYYTSNYVYSDQKWYGKSLNLREAPLRTGYTFVGWKNTAGSYESYSAGQEWTKNADTSLIAQWQRNTSITRATISFQLDGGSGASTASVTIGSEYTLPTPTRSGYTFSHWTSNHDNDYDCHEDSYVAGSVYKYSNTVTFTAHWQGDGTYKVTYYRPKFYGEDEPYPNYRQMQDGYTEFIENKSTTTFEVTNGYTDYIFGHKQDPVTSGTYHWFDHFIPRPICYRANVNLFSMRNASDGYLNYQTALLVSTDDLDVMTSEFIKVTPGTSYTYSYHADLTKTTKNQISNPWTRIWFYTSTQSGIANSMLEYSEYNYVSGENLYTYTFTAPYGASYIRISSRFLKYGFGQLTTTANHNDSYTPNTTDYNNMYHAYSVYSNPKKYPVYMQALYYAIEASVTYNANGGTNLPSPSTFKTWYNKPFNFSSKIPTKSGTTFLGWGTESTAKTSSWGANALYHGQCHSYTVYAIWAETYNLVFNTNGGTPTVATEKRISESVIALPTTKISKTGCVFKGWSAWNSTSSNVLYQPGDDYEMLPQNTTLYAIWENDSFTLTYNANGGIGAPSSEVREYNVVKKLSTTKPTRNGYEFVGWATTQSATTATYLSGANYTMPSRNTTLYAVWKALPTYIYTLIYDTGGGSVVGSQRVTSTNTTYSLTVTNTVPTKTGYTFRGWTTVYGSSAIMYVGGKSVPFTSSNCTITLYAIWQDITKYTFSLVYNTMGGSKIDTETVTTTATTYKFYVTSSKPTRLGYEFLGWTIDVNTNTVDYDTPGEEINLVNGINNTYYLYALWKQLDYNNYKLKYIYNDGGSTSTDIRNEDSYSTYDSPYNFAIQTIKPTRDDDHKFIGWTTSSSIADHFYTQNATIPTLYQSGGVIQLTSSKQEVTLYGAWQSTTDPVHVKLKFNANGGSNPPSTITSNATINKGGYYASSITIPSTIPTRNGYAFNGWSLSSSDSSGSYKANGSIEVTEVTSPVTLYATWIPTTGYVITYNFGKGYDKDTNNGQLVVSVSDSSNSRVFNIIPNSRVGIESSEYKFIGWTTNNTYQNIGYSSTTPTVSYTGEQAVTLTKSKPSLTLYAMWKELCIVDYVLNSFTETEITTTRKYYEYNTTASDVPSTDNTDYEFIGWTDNNSNISNPVTTVGIIKAKTKTLYAVYSPYKVKLVFNLSGGTGSFPDTVIDRRTSDTYTFSSSVPESTGKTFSGWYSGFWTVSSGESISINDNIISYLLNNRTSSSYYDISEGYKLTITAIWDNRTQYSVSFNTNGGRPTIADISCYEGDIVVIPETIPEKVGSFFECWQYTDGVNIFNYAPKDTIEMSMAKNITLLAMYSSELELMFYPNGGTNAPDPLSYIGTSASHVFDIPYDLPLYTGYNFLGWSLSQTATTPDYYAGGSISISYNPTVLYAVWSPKEYEVRFNLTGGVGSIDPIKALYGNTVTIPNVTPYKTGYVFDGWSIDELSSTSYRAGSVLTIPDENIILYAVWIKSPNHFVLEFNSNGGDSTVPSIIVADEYKDFYDCTISDITPTRPNYKFSGWSIDAFGTGTLYQPNSGILIKPGVTVLYAAWELDSVVDIYYNYNGRLVSLRGRDYKPDWDDSSDPQYDENYSYIAEDNGTLVTEDDGDHLAEPINEDETV